MKVRVFNTSGTLIGVCTRKRPEDIPQGKVSTPFTRKAVRKAGERQINFANNRSIA